MLSKEILKKIRHIELTTKRLLGGTRSGDTITRQKGYGLEFDQIREYQQGDDVRYIDWKSSARTNKVLVKQYYQEYSRTIMLLVDISASTSFGSGAQTKQQCLATIASVLAMVAHLGKDRVSLVLFADDVELFMPPNTGMAHVHAIMKTVFERSASAATTDYKSMLRFAGSKRSKDTVMFVLSDFIGLEKEPLLHTLARSNQLVAVRCLDSVERALPAVGLLRIQDSETGELLELDARSRGARYINQKCAERITAQDKLFRSYGIDFFDTSPNRDIMADLIRFFRKRLA